jgi:hypothetical protein
MSDPDAAPDPIDQAYAQAEALMSDDAARAARRARVLAAVARESATPPAPTALTMRRPAWRRGGWLAAASVAVLGMFLATHIYEPALRQPPTEPAAPVVPPPAAAIPTARGVAALPTPSGPVPSHTAERAPRTLAAAPPAPTPTPRDLPSVPPPPLPIPPAPRAFPSAVAAPAPAPSPVVVTAERRAPTAVTSFSAPGPDGASDEAVVAQGLARGAAKQASSPPAAIGRFGSSASLPSGQAARLRAAAAAGRTAEVATLLAQGVPVDAPDAEGNTALMRSIQADHPAAAALLRRRGASLDRKNHAGERARDMATAKGDAELNQALGLDP